MRLVWKALWAAGLLSCTGAAWGEPPEKSAVIVDYRVSEPSAERNRDDVLQPVMDALQGLTRVAEVTGMATHGHVRVEVKYRDGASRTDLAEIRERIETLALAGTVEVASREIEIGKVVMVELSPVEPGARE